VVVIVAAGRVDVRVIVDAGNVVVPVAVRSRVDTTVVDWVKVCRSVLVAVVRSVVGTNTVVGSREIDTVRSVVVRSNVDACCVKVTVDALCVVTTVLAGIVVVPVIRDVTVLAGTVVIYVLAACVVVWRSVVII
jgi:hypothetical protein